MLQIIVPARELWDEEKEEFVYTKEQPLQLEHSLVSLSKWESRWHKPYLNKQDKTEAELLDYIKCMTITQHVKPEVYENLTKENIDEIVKYINDPMTATTFSDDNKSKGGREVVTAELIYYWMIALDIPPEYRKWHLNSLLTLIKVCNIKNSPPKRRSSREIMSRNTALNAARRKKHNTRG